MTKKIDGYVINPLDTAGNWTASNILIPKGLECLETDTGRKKRGDGTHHWNDLPYEKNGRVIKINSVEVPVRSILNFTGAGVITRDLPDQDTTIIEVLMDSYVLAAPVISNDPSSLTTVTNTPITLTLTDIDSNATSVEWYITGSPTVISGALTGTMGNQITVNWGVAGNYTVSARVIGNGVTFANSPWTATSAITVNNSPGNDANTVLLIHFDGAQGSSSIVDSSAAGRGGLRHIITNSGVTLATSSPLSGTASGSFTGSNFISVPAHNDFMFDRDKCFECRVRPIAVDGSIFVQWVSGSGTRRNISITVNSEGKIELYHNRSGVNYLLTSTSIVLNQNTHIAFTFEYASRTGKLYINGVKESEIFMDGESNVIPSDNLYIGIYNESEGVNYKGYIDEIRLSNALRYASDFIPPTSNFS